MLKNVVISFLSGLVLFYGVRKPLFSQELPSDPLPPWKTLLIIKAVPENADRSVTASPASKIYSLIKQIDNCDIDYMKSQDKRVTITDSISSISQKAKDLGFERVIIVTIRETKKKSSTPAGEGADKYLLQITYGSYNIDAKLICTDTGKTTKATDSFSADAYNPSANVYKYTFAEFFKERPRVVIPDKTAMPPIQEEKPDVQMFRSIFLSGGLTGNIPIGTFSKYASFGEGIHFEAGAESYYFPNIHAVFSSDIISMNANHSKLNPYNLYPLLFSIEYQYDYNPQYSLSGRLGGGVIINDIAHTLYFDPLFSCGVVGTYHLNTRSSFFVMLSFYQFYDSLNKGSGFSISSGYTYQFNFSLTNKDDTYRIIDLE